MIVFSYLLGLQVAPEKSLCRGSRNIDELEILAPWQALTDGLSLMVLRELTDALLVNRPFTLIWLCWSRPRTQLETQATTPGPSDPATRRPQLLQIYLPHSLSTTLLILPSASISEPLAVLHLRTISYSFFVLQLCFLCFRYFFQHSAFFRFNIHQLRFGSLLSALSYDCDSKRISNINNRSSLVDSYNSNSLIGAIWKGNL